MLTEDLKYLLACVEAHTDKFPVPSHMKFLVNKIREHYDMDSEQVAAIIYSDIKYAIVMGENNKNVFILIKEALESH